MNKQSVKIKIVNSKKFMTVSRSDEKWVSKYNWYQLPSGYCVTPCVFDDDVVKVQLVRCEEMVHANHHFKYDIDRFVPYKEKIDDVGQVPDNDYLSTYLHLVKSMEGSSHALIKALHESDIRYVRMFDLGLEIKRLEECASDLDEIKTLESKLLKSTKEHFLLAASASELEEFETEFLRDHAKTNQ